jgi:hypothetical protein
LAGARGSFRCRAEFFASLPPVFCAGRLFSRPTRQFFGSAASVASKLCQISAPLKTLAQAARRDKIAAAGILTTSDPTDLCPCRLADSAVCSLQ